MKIIIALVAIVACTFVQAQQQMIHPGQCPRQTTRGPCVELCNGDGACDRDSKCCETGCGRICKKVNGNQGQGQFAAVERPPALGQRQQFGQGIGANGQRNLTPQQQQQLLQQQQQQLSGQPSLVNIGGCSRGVSLRNSDGSTLVCGFGPRDFACPPSFACTFDNSLRALVCCPAGNATQSSSQDSAAESANPCPEGEPIRNEFGNRLQCNFESGPANVCPTGTLCVVGACCPVSVAGLISVKPGKCPQPLPASPGTTCQNDCTFDADCPGPAKCCFVGCGAKCVASTVASSGAASATGNGNGNGQSGSGGPLSGNSAAISNFDLVPTRNDGIFQQQQRGGQQGFNGPQGFQFPNNGPPAFNGGLRGPPGSGQFGNGPQQQQPQQQQQQQQRSFGNGGPPQFQPINSNRQFDQATE